MGSFMGSFKGSFLGSFKGSFKGSCMGFCKGSFGFGSDEGFYKGSRFLEGPEEGFIRVLQGSCEGPFKVS